MSGGMNKWMGAGNLIEDAILRFTANGQPVVGFRIAIAETFKGKDGTWKERFEHSSCVLWGARAQQLAPSLVKGAMVSVIGPMRTSNYEKDGNKVYKTECVIDDIMVGGQGAVAMHDNGQGGHEGGPSTAPQQGYQQRSQGAGSNGGGYAPRGGNTSSGGKSSGGKSSGDFEVKFGRDKGKQISQVEDLSWLRGAMENTLGDPTKSNFHGKARNDIAAIDEEMARRNGTGGDQGASQQSQAPQRPADEYEVEGGGDMDDLPF